MAKSEANSMPLLGHLIELGEAFGNRHAVTGDDGREMIAASKAS